MRAKVKEIMEIIDDKLLLSVDEYNKLELKIMEEIDENDENENIDVIAVAHNWLENLEDIYPLKIKIRVGEFEKSVDTADLEDAKNIADEEATYTQKNIEIYVAGELVSVRKFWETSEGIKECENPIDFGEFGYYADWQEI